MGYTTLGYRAGNVGTTLAAIAALTDQHVTVSGNNILVPSFASNIIGYYALDNAPVSAQIQSPSLRTQSNLEVKPIDTGNEPTSPFIGRLFPSRPIPLTPGEQLQFHADLTAADSTTTGIIFMADKIDALPGGRIETIRTTNTSTLTLGAWTLGALTLDQQLRAGSYTLASFRAQSANLVAARAVISGSGFRPGVVGCDSVTDLQPEAFRTGSLGALGSFEHTEPPQIEFLANVADTSQIVDLDVIKT